MRRRDKLTLAVLCAGHFVNDSYSSILYPLLPLIKLKLGLTSGQVFWLAPLYAISSSLMQPVYGFISDRYARRFFAVFGPAITGVFISMIGLAPSYGVLIVLLVAGGIGIGSFHPQAAAMAANAASERRRVGMALFSALGTLGFAVGPLVITRVVSAYGLDHSYYIIATGLVMSAVLYRVCPALPAPSKSKFTPSRFLACSSGIRAPANVAGALREDVRASSELWPKSFTVNTTRSPVAWARVIRSARY